MSNKERVERLRENTQKRLQSIEKTLDVAEMEGNPKQYSEGCVGNLRQIQAALIGYLDGLDIALEVADAAIAKETEGGQ